MRDAAAAKESDIVVEDVAEIVAGSRSDP